jgi:hygromycin-B 7''-O-kinase
MPKDVYMQPDAPDPVLGDDVVLALVRRHMPSAQAVTGVDESGGEARTYTIDDDLIFKTQRPHRLRPRTSLAKEAVFLRHLAAFPPILVPRVLGYGREESVEYLCMTRMPGASVTRQIIAGAARAGVLRALGQTLRQIHAVPQAPLATSGLFPGDQTAADLSARLTEAFDEVLVALQSAGDVWEFAHSPRVVAGAALAALPYTAAFVALHSNPGAEHTFADQVTQTYTGTIDFGDAYISHPALDLRRWKDPADREALLVGYLTAGPVDEAFMAVWRVTQIWADMATVATTPEHRDAAHAHLRRILAEL